MNWRLFSPATWRAGMLDAIQRFPLAVLCGAVGTGCAIVGIHNSKDDALVGQCERLAMTVALGLPLFFALRIVRERLPRWSRYPFELLGLPLLAWWFLTHAARPSEEPGIVFIRWGLLLAALHFSAAISPYVRGTEGRGFWQFNRQLFLRFALATLYTGVLTAGFELALFSADKLFELRLDKTYADLWFVMIGCFHPAFFLAGVPRDFEQLEADAKHPRGLKAFTQFALAPLVLVYGLILYAYAGKIILLRSWPHGWVALPVLILSGVGIFAALLLHPLRNDPAEKWAVWFRRIFPPALGPLAILLLLSLRVRIVEYGITEERYVGVVASLWIAAWSIVFTVRRNAGIRWIPASLAVIAIAVAFGPWSAGAVSRRSQLTRAKKMLQAHGLWTGAQAKPADQRVELTNSEGTSLRSTIQYLIRVHGAASVQPMFASVLPNEKWSNAGHWNAASAIVDGLNVTIAHEQNYRTFTRETNLAIDVQGFRRAWPLNIWTQGEAPWKGQACDELRIGLLQGNLQFALNETEPPTPVSMDEFFSRLPLTTTATLPAEQMQIDFERGGRSFRIVFENVDIIEKEKRPTISRGSFLLLER